MNRAEILKIDLNRSRCSVEEIHPNLLKAFLGGRGLSYKLLQDNLSSHCLPLEPQAPLIFSAGLLAGTSAPASGRLQITALSPATGLLGTSNAGGFFAPHLAANGFMALLITGRADRPVSLWIENGRAELWPADDLWGLDTWQTCERLGQSKRVQTAVIGPAGENQVPLACVMFGPHSAAGRTGMGAVMGSKNLKAVVVAADPRKQSRLPTPSREVIEAWLKELRAADQYKKISQEGQSGYLPWAHEMGILGTRNFQDVSFPESEAFDSRNMLKHRSKRRGCARCPVMCKADVKVSAGAYAGLTGPRPEFESLASLGPRCGISDLEAVYSLSNQCGRLGMDTISAGAAVAFAMELFEKGLLTDLRADGLDLEWGKIRTVEALLDQMAYRKGFGKVLSDGVDKAAGKIGGRASDYAFTVKGLEMSAYDPRTLNGTALGYAVAGRGGDFGSVFPTPEYRWSSQRALEELGFAGAADRFSQEGKPELVRRCLIVNTVLDSLGLCKVPALGILNDFSLNWESRMVNALSTVSTDAKGLMEAGERAVNLERLINLAQGADSSDDRLPDHFRTHGAPSGPAQGKIVDLDSMLREFYRIMGWDDKGRPGPEKLAEMGLAEAPRSIMPDSD